MKIFDEIPYIESERIVVRKIEKSDAQGLSALINNDNVYKYLPTFLFEKKYSDIKSIDRQKIIFNDWSAFFWEYFDSHERNISAKPPYFHFFSEFIELFVYFDEGKILSGKNKKDFLDFQLKLSGIGINTLDLS